MHIAVPTSYLGTQLHGRYRLDRLMGEGASAWVFAAHDERLDRAIAVKLLKASVLAPGTHSPRFVEEGRTLAKLVHPHVVAVYDAGETPEGLAYLVMELSDAGTLESELFRRGSLPPGETLRLLVPLLGALACAHDRGIIHRDLKPANIVLVHQHGETYSKLLDFGIAKSREVHSSGVGLGTPSFMAPEQARGEPLSAAADVWALGVVFFRCLSGSLPFEATSSAALLLKLVQERAPRFSVACKELTPRVAAVLDRALEPQPARRYHDMRSFARALALACAQDGVAVAARPDPIGLPEFEAWLSGAAAEETRPLADMREARHSLVSARERRSMRALGKSRLLWGVAIGAALVGALWSVHGRAAPRQIAQRIAKEPARVVAGAPPARPAPAHPAAHSESEPVGSEPSGSALCLPLSSPSVGSAEAPGAAARGGAARKRPKAAKVAAASAAVQPQPERAGAGLITTWDW